MKDKAMLDGKKIAIIGAGNMGSALVAGIVTAKLAPQENVTAKDVVPELLERLKQHYGVKTTSDDREAVRPADIVILAMKPQIMSPVLESLRTYINESQTVISIAAGIRTSFIEEGLKSKVPVVRVMPNILISIGAGISALCGGVYAKKEHLDLASKILGAVGDVVYVEEKYMDAVTGLSASGPAYVYSIIDGLADGGVKMGLTKDVALRLAASVVLGSAKMVIESGEHPGVLKDRVTSPGGTTIAGLHALEKYSLKNALMSAVEAATLRAQELGKE